MFDETCELCDLEAGGESLEHVPENLRSAELCRKMVMQCGYELKFVPEKHKTAELCLAAVKLFGHALLFVPDSLKTAKLCLEAVKVSGGALKHVPDELKTAEFCLKAVQGHKAVDTKKGTLTKSDIDRLLVGDGSALEFVPEELKAQVEMQG